MKAEAPLTYCYWKKVFIVYLLFNPFHQMFNISWSWKPSWFLVVDAIAPVILVSEITTNFNQ